MNPSQDLAIQKNYKFLVDHLDFSHVRDHLVEEGVLNNEICEEIDSEKTRSKEIRKFLGILPKRGPHAFPAFIKALNESGNEFIVKHLEDFINTVEQTGQCVSHPQDAASVATSSMQTLALSDTDAETPVTSGSATGTPVQAPPADSGDTNIVPSCTAGSTEGKTNPAPPADSTQSVMRVSHFSTTIFETFDKREEIKKRTSCDGRSCAGNTPTSHCVECDTSFCQECTEIHNEFHHKHYIFNISEIDRLNDNVFYRKAFDLCKKHETEIYKFYCVPCNEIICGDCALTTHSGNDHRRVDLAQKNQDWRHEMKSYHNDIQRAQIELSEQMRNMESSITHEREKLIELLIQVDESQVKLNETIDSYFKEIKNRLTIKSEGNRDILNRRKAEIEHNLNFVDELLEKYQKIIDFSANTELHKSLDKLKGIIANDKQKEKISNVPLERATYTAWKIDSNVIKALTGDVIEGSPDYLTDTGVVAVSGTQWGATDVAVTSSGDVVVCGLGAGAVLYNQTGYELCTLPPPSDVRLWTPLYVASSADRIFVSNEKGGDIVEYSARGELVRVLLRGLQYPGCLAVCQDKLVIMYSLSEKINTYGIKDRLNLIKSLNNQLFSRVTYVTINKSSRDLVISHVGGVTAVDTDFAPRWSYPCTDSDPGTLRHPQGVATSPSGDVFVADRDSGRVLRLTQHGQFKRAYQMPGSRDWVLSGVCINDHEVIITGFGSSRLYKFRY